MGKQNLGRRKQSNLVNIMIVNFVKIGKKVFLTGKWTIILSVSKRTRYCWNSMARLERSENVLFAYATLPL